MGALIDGFDRISLPIEPLWKYCELQEGLSISLFAEMINCGRKSVYRWIESGVLPLLVAESICDHMGIHPTEVWGKEYYFACYLHEERIREIKHIREKRNRQKRKEAKCQTTTGTKH